MKTVKIAFAVALAVALFMNCGGDDPLQPSSALRASKPTTNQATSGSQSTLTPIRPVSGSQVLGFGVKVSWASKPHNGIDYRSNLWNTVTSVGPGALHFFTKPDADRFGSINPDGRGPAIWQKCLLSTGEPIYILYGHTADSWNDRSTGTGKTFKFNCTYKVKAPGTDLGAGVSVGQTAPVYNGGVAQPHLHLSVFKPKKDKNGVYYGPPSNGWGYSDIVLPTGEFINPEIFFKSYKLK